MAAGRQPKFDPRKLMERAIEAMRCSIHEPRDDGRANPLVGAVLWKPDGTIEAACRGEIRDGDHAEYTLLERKNRDTVLDGSILFATLEPCAPGARRHPKLGCAERIVLARIRRVWVGIEDPDPTVDRKGIKYLQENGVDVQMFDRDLQEVILSENQSFIAQAHERAKAAAQAKPKEVTLSRFESAFTATVIDDLSIPALEAFRARAGIDSTFGSPAFNRLLLQLGLAEQKRDGVRPTGFGFLLFGKNPRQVMQQAGVLAIIEHPGGKFERREFDEPLVLIPELVEKWLRDKLPNISERDEMRRRDVPALPYELVREGLVNALIHRDYDVAGAKCQLVVSEETVTIRSPGRPPAPITVEQLQSFTAPMLSRNPPLHYVFARMELAEEQGLGVRSMRVLAERGGLPLPRYTWDDPYLVLTLYRNPQSATVDLTALPTKLNADETAAWQFIATKDSVTSRDLIRKLSFDERKAQRILRKLTSAGLLKQVGRGPATRFEVVRA